MTTTQVTLNDDQFEETYKPVQNHLNPNASWGGCMFDTSARELEHVHAVLKTDPGKVWTVLDCDGVLTVGSGYHLINRMGYIITEVAVPDGTMVEVEDDDQPDEEADDSDE